MADYETLHVCRVSQIRAAFCSTLRAHCARQGLRKVVIRIVDTDVVALAIEHFPALRLDELWVSFGVGTLFQQIAIHEIVKNVNEKAIMFLHAINGCDTVSSFLGCGKKSAWLAWSSCPSVTDALGPNRSISAGRIFNLQF